MPECANTPLRQSLISKIFREQKPPDPRSTGEAASNATEQGASNAVGRRGESTGVARGIWGTCPPTLLKVKNYPLTLVKHSSPPFLSTIAFFLLIHAIIIFQPFPVLPTIQSIPLLALDLYHLNFQKFLTTKMR
jgi:hypothetical protein